MSLVRWILILVLVGLLMGVSLQIPGNTGYPPMGVSPGGHGGQLVAGQAVTPLGTLPTPTATSTP